MKLYQSPLLITSAILIVPGVFYYFHFLLVKDSWGLLFALPAFIIGGLAIILHYLLRPFFQTQLKKQVALELIILTLAVLFFYLFFY
jgi:hypothetical protein